MPLKTKEAEKGLLQKGFRRRNTDHATFWLFVGDERSEVWTKISFGASEIDDSMVSRMARQVFLSRKDFVNLVQCPLSREDYLARLRDQGILPA
jgi:hypothetical protein